MQAGQLILPKPRERQRLALHRQGLTDKQIAAAVGVSYQSIAQWRKYRALPPNPAPRSAPKAGVPMETALSPGECEVVRDFFRFLLRHHQDTGRTDVAQAMQVYRAEYNGYQRKSRKVVSQ